MRVSAGECQDTPSVFGELTRTGHDACDCQVPSTVNPQGATCRGNGESPASIEGDVTRAYVKRAACQGELIGHGVGRCRAKAGVCTYANKRSVGVGAKVGFARVCVGAGELNACTPTASAA